MDDQFLLAELVFYSTRDLKGGKKFIIKHLYFLSYFGSLCSDIGHLEAFSLKECYAFIPERELLQ